MCFEVIGPWDDCLLFSCKVCAIQMREITFKTPSFQQSSCGDHTGSLKTGQARKSQRLLFLLSSHSCCHQIHHRIIKHFLQARDGAKHLTQITQISTTGNIFITSWRGLISLLQGSHAQPEMKLGFQVGKLTPELWDVMGGNLHGANVN